MSDALRYPIGQFDRSLEVRPADRPGYIERIAALPARAAEAVHGLTDEQLDTPYRSGGWTLRQTIHHLADSHINSYVRFRLALTESEPVIKPYDEKAWAELPDASGAPVDVSLAMLSSLHERWSMLLRAMTDADYARTFVHPERGAGTLAMTLALYAWHGDHHVEQILALRRRMGW